jgi:hypothetical protein
MRRKTLVLIVFGLAGLLQVSPSPLHALSLAADGFVSASLPNGTNPIILGVQADLDGDGRPEGIILENGKAMIGSADRHEWQSPETWQVIQAGITDLNHDHSPEATLLVWRPYRPWPVDEWLPQGGRITTFQDERGYSCQLILIGWVDGGYREVWAGSALAEPVRSFSAGDLDGDGRQELITLEGTYADSRSAPAHELKAWEWNGFGFSIVSKSSGIFDTMALIQSGNGQILILVP